MKAEASLEAPRLLLCGPAYPFRGGIAQHTSNLLEALRQGPLPDTHLLSYRRLYPGWLYPGSSQLEPGHDDKKLEGADYLLDGCNPLTWWQAVRQWDQAKPEILLIPWWTFFWAPLVRYLHSQASKRGIPTVLLIHNQEDHDASWWKKKLARWGQGHPSAFVTHNRQDAETCRLRFPQVPVFTFPHPTYRQFELKPEVAPLPRRAKWELLFFGLVRPYKGLDVLLEALRRLDDPSDLALTIAGEWWSQDQDLKASVAVLSERMTVEVIDEFVSDTRAGALFQRSDIVVLPYRRATNSGVLGVAQTHGKAVVASNTGALGELVLPGQTGELFEPGNANDLAAALQRVLNRPAGHYAPAAREAAQAASWEIFASTLASFLDEHFPRSA